MARNDDLLRAVLLRHHPLARSQTGTLTGCRCGGVRLGEDVIAHVMAEIHAALDAPAVPLDQRPHSRACGITRHEHGPDCSSNCPTCGGQVMGQPPLSG